MYVDEEVSLNLRFLLNCSNFLRAMNCVIFNLFFFLLSWEILKHRSFRITINSTSVFMSVVIFLVPISVRISAPMCANASVCPNPPPRITRSELGVNSSYARASKPSKIFKHWFVLRIFISNTNRS